MYSDAALQKMRDAIEAGLDLDDVRARYTARPR
jgi:hypothetical protein